MLDHPTLDQKALRLDGMAAAFTELQAQDAAGDLTHAEWLGLLIDREVASRNTRALRTDLRRCILDRLVQTPTAAQAQRTFAAQGQRPGRHLEH